MAEHMTPVVAKVLPEEKAAFAAATQRVGTTPSNAIRMFIAAFNRCGTFPFDISPAGAFGLCAAASPDRAGAVPSAGDTGADSAVIGAGDAREIAS